jgi:hypothetical protein
VVAEHVRHGRSCLVERVHPVDDHLDGSGVEQPGEGFQVSRLTVQFTNLTFVEPSPSGMAPAILRRRANMPPVLPTLLGMRIPPG